MTSSCRRRLGALFAVTIAWLPLRAFQHPKEIESLADQYIRLRLDYDPTLAYAIGVPPSDNMHLPDQSPAALRDLHVKEDELLKGLAAPSVAPAGALDPTSSVLREELESRQELRVCVAEYWDVNHMQGWQIELPALAGSLPAATPRDRDRVLRLWRTLPQYVDTDIANLRTGLARGYAVPRTVVARVLRQLDALLASPVEDSPFYAPAKTPRNDSGEFTAALRQEINEQIAPAISKYAEFLREEYLPRARESLGLSALKDGAACYQAYLRRYTTTNDTPGFVLAAGQRIVKSSTKEIESIGERLYGTKKLVTIIERSHHDPRNRFTSSLQLLDLTNEIVSRSEQSCRGLFSPFPSQRVVVKPLPSYQQGSGISSNYAANPDDRQSATFWIATDQWRTETRGAAQITAVHETVPGHHLQIATARELHPAGLLSKLVFNAAYSEGWAHYAEQLAEEQGIDSDEYERIQRRVLAGRSLLIDPGIHAFAWTRERAEAVAMETGMSKEQADDVIDRIAVEPGQLISYEIGGIEILSLREAAKRRMGAKFQVGAFHRCVLEDGPLPLTALRVHVHNCLAATK